MEEINLFNAKEITDFTPSQIFVNLEKLSKTLPAQRTPGWFKMRHRMITASDWGSVFGKSKFKTYNQLILDKCGYGKPFKPNPITQWGTKYEDVANAIYEKRTNMKVYEFGCMPHQGHTFLGASPDGISKNGIMLEIKCPARRKINQTIPAQYYIQMQGQLEVCDLDRCDYLECELEQIHNIKDDDQKQKYNEAPMEKGATIEFLNSEGHIIYFYSPLDITIDEGYKWFSKMIMDHRVLQYKKNGFSFWILKKVFCTTVMRDKAWFNRNALPKLRDTWQIILDYREENLTENEIRRKLGMRLNKIAKNLTKEDKEEIKSAELKSITADIGKMSFKQAQKTDKIFTNMQFGACMFSMTTEDYKSDDPNENNMMFSMPSREDLI
jgi:putative phage-type endonuclease